MDVGKSTAYAIPKAIIGFFGAGGDVRDLSAAARRKILGWLPDSIRPVVAGAANVADYLNPVTAAAKLAPAGAWRPAYDILCGDRAPAR